MLTRIKLITGLWAGMVAVALVAVGCGSDDDTPSAVPSAPATSAATTPDPEATTPDAPEAEAPATTAPATTEAPTTTEPPSEPDMPDVPAIPPELEGTFGSFGNPEADTVVIVTQGGPVTFLLGPEVLVEEVGQLNPEQVQLVSVHQAQTLEPDRFIAADISFDDAKAADAASVAMLADVVAYFKDQGKTVHVVGFSFGAFMVQDLLATQGNIADGYLIKVGRVDMPDEVWTEFSEGRAVGFVDGVEIVKFDIADAGMGGETPEADRNMARLAAGLGHKRYTELLADIDLSNVVYVYGDVDEQVGRLSEAEVAFLESRSATVIEYEGGHATPADVTQDAISRLLAAELLLY